MASPNDYNNLVQVIKKLDRRSKQVFVQVLIAEVSLDKSNEFGLQTGLIGGGSPNNNLTVAGMYDPLGTLAYHRHRHCRRRYADSRRYRQSAQRDGGAQGAR